MKKKDKKIKIAILIRNFDYSGGGAEKYCVELSKLLSNHYDVHIFTQKIVGEYTNLSFHLIPTILKKPRFINQLLFSFFTKRALKNEFAIVHSHDMLTHANIYTIHVPCFKTQLTKKTAFGKLYFLLKLLFSPRFMSYLWLEKEQMKFVHKKKIISVSNLLTNNIILNYPKIKNIITLASPGINQQYVNFQKIKKSKILDHLEIPKNSFVYLFAAHGFERKGLPNILEAMNELKSKNIHLVVAGRGDSSPYKDKIINVHFLGEVKNMMELYSCVDAMIHPTLGDTFGMTVLEAMACKLPVIVSSSKYCGISGRLKHNQAIILKNPNDTNEIALRMKQLYEDKSLYSAISSSGQKAAKNFTWKTTLEETVKAYKTILE